MGWIWYDQADADQLMKDIKANTGHFAPYLTKAKADTYYLAAGGTGPKGYVTQKYLSDQNYLNKTDAGNLYAPKGNYLTQGEGVNKFLTQSAADALYAVKGNYLTQNAADGLYATKGNYLTQSVADGLYAAKTTPPSTSSEHFGFRRGAVNPRMNCNQQPHHFRQQVAMAKRQPSHVLSGDMASQKILSAVQTPSYIAVDNQGCLVYPGSSSSLRYRSMY
jgi:hypothetical protein